MADEEIRTLLVFGQKTFQIKVPTTCKITFGPFSPPGKHGFANNPSGAIGTLRIYESYKTGAPIVGVFSGVSGFRDMNLDYMEEVAREEGARIWKSDEKGYMREEKSSSSRAWVVPGAPELEVGKSDIDVDDNVF